MPNKHDNILTSQVIIIDVVETGVSSQEREGLLDLFEYLMKRTAMCGAVEAVFRLKEFETAKKCGLTEFELHIKTESTVAAPIWIGEFTHGEKRLEVVGMLENPDEV